MFHLYRSPSSTCEIRFDFQERSIEEIPLLQRRAFMRQGSDLLVVNAWLAVLAADTGYAVGTVYEYAKVLLYALEWLAQEPVTVSTREPVGYSLLSLQHNDLRSLFAWLDIPAHQQAERLHLAKTGLLPPGYRKNALSSSTRNLRNAALSAFYDWVIVVYRSTERTAVELAENPLKDIHRPLPRSHQRQRHDGLLPRTGHRTLAPSRPFRRRSNENETGPIALTPHELQLVLEAIPLVSQGRNAANRNGALIRLLLWGMLRKEELVEARWEAVNDDMLWVVGKGRKRRAVSIADPSTWSYLQTYTNELRIPPEQRFHGALLRQLDHEERPITRHTIEHLIDSLCKHFFAKAVMSGRSSDNKEAQSSEVLAQKIHSHIFRATGATYMAKAGMNLLKLSLLLGHSDPSTTMRYYVAAEQLDLPEEVRRVWEGIAETLDTTPPSASPRDLPNPRSWYQRRGLIPS